MGNFPALHMPLKEIKGRMAMYKCRHACRLPERLSSSMDTIGLLDYRGKSKAASSAH